MSKLENKNLMNKKSAYALFITMFLVILFSIYSLSIIENNTFSQRLNHLKYLHLQAKIYMDNMTQFIDNSTENEIESFILDDDRYQIKILKIMNDENITNYIVSIETTDDTPLRLSKSIVK